MKTQKSPQKSRVALVYPPINPENDSIRDLGTTPPLHLMALGAVLRDRDVRIFDGVHKNLGQITSELQDFSPDVVGMNVDLTNYDTAMKLADRVPGRVILGGNYAAFLAPQILANQPAVEAVCFNDGEMAIRGFVDGDMTAPNLIHRGGRNPVDLLDVAHLPTPAYDLVNMEDYFERQREVFGPDFKMMQFYGQKGCVNHPHCSFCGRYEDGMRLRDPEEYSAEVIKHVKEFGLTEVWDRSDSFLQNRNWFSIIHSRLRGLGPRFKTYARADQLDDEVVSMLGDMNFRSVYIGYEAGDDSLLREMNKNETTEQYLESSRKVLGAGIDVDGSFIIGLPGENKKTLENQVQFVNQLADLGLKKIKVNRVLVLPGTPLYRRVCDAYPAVRSKDSFGISDMQRKLYSTYDLSDFGGSVDNFVERINSTAEVMTQTILDRGGCAEGYGYEKKSISGGSEV
ncbi:hypothetical protein CMI41_02060 [Candidatus Pacearchaeota archaeon]|nr:hypothetical protein [Candidatus Pacearchaeota archaeon]|tara:strand:+ start:4807 stop:6171 length:1365 start_codon:yes stop_codon:yes gene_type:complete